MESNKHVWYNKLLVKLRQIEAGELQLADYIAEVEGKLAEVDDSLHAHYMLREPEKKSLQVILIGSGHGGLAMESIIMANNADIESIPMQMVELPQEIPEIKRDMMDKLRKDIEKDKSFLIKSSPVIAEPLIYSGDLTIPSKRAQRRKKEREMKKRKRK